MPKKRHNVKSFKPTSTAFPTQASASASADNKAPKSVNQLLANLRHAQAGQSASSSSPSSSSRAFPTTSSPSVPPAIREILQIPETPAPLPRRPVRQRFDRHGRRLPAGPPPPQSWTTSRADGVAHDGGRGRGSSTRSARVSAGASGLVDATLPGVYLPGPGSLIDLVLRKLAVDWPFHRVFNQYHLYFVPSHLKPALIRWIGLANDDGLSVSDLKTILIPPPDVYDDDELATEVSSNAQITYLDLSGSWARLIRLKDVSELLFPTRQASRPEEVNDSWDTTDTKHTHPPVLLPNLTHLSLAADPEHAPNFSWRQLLAIAPKLSTVTHLSLAHWPDPCFTPRARFSSVTSPQGQNIPYAGTNYYSHSVDHDWSEALLVLRLLSQSLYKLEFLDLTGCAPWFRALMERAEHDFVDWVGVWGKVSTLRLCTGWKPGLTALPSEKIAFRDALEMAGNVERHIVAMRAGKGRFITVERDKIDD